MEKILNHNGIRFYAREGSSDEKTFKEVIEKNSYQKKYFKIEAGESWLDLGGNVGAFTVLAAKLGAKVTTIEPDPKNIEQIKKNLALNGLSAEIIQAACVHDDQKTVKLNLWPEGQSWRNSIVRNKKGTTPITVPALNFYELYKNFECVKMDIEGSEIPILKSFPKEPHLKKLVFEWSFDADPRVEVLRIALSRLKQAFKTVHHTSQVSKVELWKFFPPCTMVHCYNSSES